jgi:hypothetical protein
MRPAIASAIASVLAAASAFTFASGQQASPDRIFAARAEELSSPGVKTTDGITFATIVARGDREGPLSTPAALRAMLQARLHETLPTSGMQPAVGRAAAFAAVGCVEGRIDASGLTRVSESRLPGGMVRVVHALPAARLDAVDLRLPQLLECLDERLVSGRAAVADVLLLGELVPEAQAPGALVRSLAAVCGDGISTTASGAWVREDGLPPVGGLRGWQEAIAGAVREGGNFETALRPLDAAAVGRIEDAEEAIRQLGLRANDASLLARARELLARQGWSRCVAQLPTGTAAIEPAKDRAGSRLPASLRAQVASLPAVAVLLLTDGRCPIRLSAGPGPNHARAMQRFDESALESYAAAVELLRHDFEAAPGLEGGVLLSMSLLALNDPGLAAPISRACCRVAPEHPYAGVAALLSLRMLDRKDAARALLPEVESRARVNRWGREQLDELRAWCGLPARTVGPPAAPAPVSVQGGSDDEP